MSNLFLKWWAGVRTPFASSKTIKYRFACNHNVAYCNSREANGGENPLSNAQCVRIRQTKKTPLGVFIWWAGVDSNHRTLS